MNYIEKCQDVYDSAIIANLQLRMQHAHNFECMSPHQYMYEVGTVSINLGRRTGKTYYINYKNEYNKDIILTRYNAHERYSEYDHSCNIIDIPNSFDMRFILGYMHNRPKPSTIWVDDASHIKESVLDEVLHFLYTEKNQTVVKLG